MTRVPRKPDVGSVTSVFGEMNCLGRGVWSVECVRSHVYWPTRSSKLMPKYRYNVEGIIDDLKTLIFRLTVS